MSLRSAGVLMYKRMDGQLFVLLVHPGGPFWRNTDLGAWSIPKGEVAENEDAETAARREFAEELGAMPAGALRPLGSVQQNARKKTEAFTMEADFDATCISSNLFEIEWPPRSGRMQSFPEIDRAAWFALPMARQKILPGQQILLDRLEALFGPDGGVN
ncbi:NUDIX domain-containing protein [Methylocella tundrae]|uniref:Predicted NTP pyrophosphohydrolase, NUDIX family n=1 Tax=Methylocella tundrae TaxID=227605 RepID=A0A4U8Z689_METTU|nr:NUDIX domain-containing protein [Methylocella tundrae]WPP04669.1 NUDIX domain-containing protein [Methylocella tundrae]VFU11127.1 Predicted NTP pyrophosphohydrolase, NUDIX family [Methylocella tundrae]